jgi:SAM-dependent methyltransferase
MSQEQVWRDKEADAWFRRNGDALLLPAEADDPVLASLATFDLPDQGTMLDLGGSTGRFAAGFLRSNPGWSAHVLELSREAIAAGRKAFPDVRFSAGSIAEPMLPVSSDKYDLVVVSAVLQFVERGLLSRAIANTDSALNNGGLLILYDFDPPYPRANAYAHNNGCFTYKQNYTSCFLSLGIYHLEYQRSYVTGTAADPSDPYDRQWMTAIFRKDVQGRYFKAA